MCGFELLLHIFFVFWELFWFPGDRVPVHPLLWPAWVLSTLLRLTCSPFILTLLGPDRSDLFRCNLQHVLFVKRAPGIWSLSWAEVMMATWHAENLGLKGGCPGEMQHRGFYCWGNLPSHWAPNWFTEPQQEREVCGCPAYCLKTCLGFVLGARGGIWPCLRLLLCLSSCWRCLGLSVSLQRCSGGGVALGPGNCNPVSAVKSVYSLGADCLISAWSPLKIWPYFPTV